MCHEFNLNWPIFSRFREYTFLCVKNLISIYLNFFQVHWPWTPVCHEFIFNLPQFFPIHGTCISVCHEFNFNFPPSFSSPPNLSSYTTYRLSPLTSVSLWKETIRHWNSLNTSFPPSTQQRKLLYIMCSSSFVSQSLPEHVLFCQPSQLTSVPQSKNLE